MCWFLSWVSCLLHLLVLMWYLNNLSAHLKWGLAMASLIWTWHLLKRHYCCHRRPYDVARRRRRTTSSSSSLMLLLWLWRTQILETLYRPIQSWLSTIDKWQRLDVVLSNVSKLFAGWTLDTVHLFLTLGRHRFISCPDFLTFSNTRPTARQKCVKLHQDYTVLCLVWERDLIDGQSMWLWLSFVQVLPMA